MDGNGMSIRAIFFDFGGVIQRTEYQAPRQRLAGRFGMDYDDLDKLIFNSPSARQATVGAIPAEAHWEAVAKKLKIGADEIAGVEREFFAGDVVDLRILDYLRSLRPRFVTGLISNAWSDMRGYLMDRKIADVFDCLVISAEAGAAKPEAKIYLLALDQAQVKAGEAVFVDDVPANIEAAKKIGMKTILFKEPREALERLGNLLGE